MKEKETDYYKTLLVTVARSCVDFNAVLNSFLHNASHLFSILGYNPSVFGRDPLSGRPFAILDDAHYHIEVTPHNSRISFLRIDDTTIETFRFDNNRFLLANIVRKFAKREKTIPKELTELNTNFEVMNRYLGSAMTGYIWMNEEIDSLEQKMQSYKSLRGLRDED